MHAFANAALRCGRRCRRQTEIGRNPRDVSTVAIQLAERLVGDLEGRQVVVVGVGEMGVLAVKSLSQRGVRSIAVVNRRIDAAQRVAERWGATAHSLNELNSLIERADVVITSTSSRKAIISPQLVKEAVSLRRNRPLALIDLSLPRNIDPLVSKIEGVQLFDLEGLRGVVDSAEADRASSIPKSEEIVQEELILLRSSFGELAVRPVISQLWKGAERTREELVADAKSRLQGLDAEQWQEIDRLTRLLTRKLLHAPSSRLRSETLNGHAVEFSAVFSELFGLQAGPDADL